MSQQRDDSGSPSQNTASRSYREEMQQLGAFPEQSSFYAGLEVMIHHIVSNAFSLERHTSAWNPDRFAFRIAGIIFDSLAWLSPLSRQWAIQFLLQHNLLALIYRDIAALERLPTTQKNV